VASDPVGQRGFVELAAGECDDEGHNLFFGGVDSKAIQPEKEIHGLEGYPLVAIDERVVAGETEAVGSG